MGSSSLQLIQEEVRVRTEGTTASRPDWPCRKGCDECCRRLASVPVVTEEEWRALATAINELPSATAAVVRQRIRDSSSAGRPIVCPLLESHTGACLVYTARPVACRSYGFYVERDRVLGCSRIEAIADQASDVVWGNHVTLNERLQMLGPAMELYRWVDRDLVG